MIVAGAFRQIAHQGQKASSTDVIGNDRGHHLSGHQRHAQPIGTEAMVNTKTFASVIARRIAAGCGPGSASNQ